MHWVDYREKLGIGFTDAEKFKLLQVKMINLLEVTEYKIPYENDSYFPFCIMVGIPYYKPIHPISKISEILSNVNSSIEEFLAIYMAFVNTFVENKYSELGNREVLINMLTNMMRQTKIDYEVQKDEEENEYFIFPKGAPELDDALVSAPLEWLCDYPTAHKTYTIALKQYSEGEYIRDVADNFRKTLEAFLQEFFGNNSNLDANINVTGKYLKAQGADKEISDVLVKLIELYKKLNDKIAKHNDKVDEKFLEFLMYQTGLFIRMLIVVKRVEQKEEK